MDNLRHANQLLHWAEQQQLTSQQLQQAAKQVKLQAVTTDWLAQANRLLLFAAVMLLSSAVIFFFAYNWPLLHYLAKMALAGTAVLLSGGIAVVSTSDSLQRRAALFTCAILTGALLALIGQTYQTGADIWQLFAGWAALISPLVLLSKSRASYLLWFVLLQLTLWRYLDSNAGFWSLNHAQQLLFGSLANLLWLLFAEFALRRLGVAQHKPLLWLAALTLLAPLTFAGILGVWESNYQLNLLSYLLIAAVLALWYFRLQPDLLIFALVLFSAIAVSTAMLSRLMDGADGFMLVNLLALYVIGSSAAAAVWLKKLLQDAQHDQ
ncbi:MAG: DUF2157 domain-containing protein [Gammaproteobacteria bacterium]|nr:DUF2157 domain-containing protein [Gammaproteobacteria bacterium]MBU1553381.1 DUF2157 domain-containing protein [Gammaproteobacteria bacterium]MBU2070050.1 DUF2157 domain-containing protein [Gammaproteobacteria bacterium]MBU2183654.1 DUF2157 domain-containing protein [Gammaproteobacteria bacterium]MBU2205584.1 DUF2157 domain-containing protein [Gammaproteobacteria bacterium]